MQGRPIERWNIVLDRFETSSSLRLPCVIDHRMPVLPPLLSPEHRLTFYTFLSRCSLDILLPIALYNCVKRDYVLANPSAPRRSSAIANVPMPMPTLLPPLLLLLMTMMIQGRFLALEASNSGNDTYCVCRRRMRMREDTRRIANREVRSHNSTPGRRAGGRACRQSGRGDAGHTGVPGSRLEGGVRRRTLNT